jgi:hypothetical protein
VSDKDGGVGGYLASASLADLTFHVAFTPWQINPGAVNTVAFIGGPSGCCLIPGKAEVKADRQSAALSVQIDATGTLPYVAATVRGNDGTTITLTSRVQAVVNHQYTVLVRRTGSRMTLEVNGYFQTEASYGVPLTGLESWSLAAEATLTPPASHPFQGVIRSFEVEGSR